MDQNDDMPTPVVRWSTLMLSPEGWENIFWLKHVRTRLPRLDLAAWILFTGYYVRAALLSPGWGWPFILPAVIATVLQGVALALPGDSYLHIRSPLVAVACWSRVVLGIVVSRPSSYYSLVSTEYGPMLSSSPRSVTLKVLLFTSDLVTNLFFGLWYVQKFQVYVVHQVALLVVQVCCGFTNIALALSDAHLLPYVRFMHDLTIATSWRELTTRGFSAALGNLAEHPAPCAVPCIMVILYMYVGLALPLYLHYVLEGRWKMEMVTEIRRQRRLPTRRADDPNDDPLDEDSPLALAPLVAHLMVLYQLWDLCRELGYLLVGYGLPALGDRGLLDISVVCPSDRNWLSSPPTGSSVGPTGCSPCAVLVMTGLAVSYVWLGAALWKLRRGERAAAGPEAPGEPVGERAAAGPEAPGEPVGERAAAGPEAPGEPVAER